jgi:hypothetical protein
MYFSGLLSGENDDKNTYFGTWPSTYIRFCDGFFHTGNRFINDSISDFRSKSFRPKDFNVYF